VACTEAARSQDVPRQGTQQQAAECGGVHQCAHEGGHARWAAAGRTRAATGWQQPAALPGQVQVLEQLGGSDQATSAPIWASFCGVSNGAWQGTQTAFAPGTGRPRPTLPAARGMCQPASASSRAPAAAAPGSSAERLVLLTERLHAGGARVRAARTCELARLYNELRTSACLVARAPRAHRVGGRRPQASRRRSGRTRSGAR